MSETEAKLLKSVEWFPKVGGPEKKSGVGSSLVKLAVGGAVGLLLFLSHRTTAAYVVWAIAGAVGAVSIASAQAREAIDGALAKFGRWVGTALGAVLLTIVYAVVVTPTRFVRRLLGADDLHLRDGNRASYWLACDADERKVAYVGTMFATEVRPPGGGHPLRTAILSIVALLLLAEGVARTKGFGHTVLYVADPDIGYYPQPSAELNRYGGRVATNKFGMRSAEVERTKPAGAFRILMIGDSTLYGGSYVDQEDMYATQVDKHLNAPSDGTRLPGKVEVLAMGCNGWGPFHERGFLRRNADAFQADVVMVQMPIDDVNRPLYGLMEVPFFAVQTPPRFALEEIFNHLVWRYREGGSGKNNEWEARQAQYGINEFGLLVDDIQRSGAEAMVFVLPRIYLGFDKPAPVPQSAAEDDPANRMLFQLKTDKEWTDQLAAVVAKRGVTTEQARGYFKGKGTDEEIYRDDGVHLNPKGHRVYAGFIEERLKADSLRFQAWAAGHNGGDPHTPGPPAPAPAKPADNTQPAVNKN